MKNDNQFRNYREIISKFASVGACGHPIKVGDSIGYNRRHGAQCSACWSKWAAENAAADFDEAQYNSQY